MANANYQILVTAKVLKGDVQKQLNAIAKELKTQLKIDLQGTDKAASGLKDMGDEAKKAKENVGDLGLTVDAASKVLNTAIDTIRSFTEQVFELNKAQIEFQKVSDLSGTALDEYTSKLAKAGQSVARTGKPNRSEPGCWDSKPAA